MGLPAYYAANVSPEDLIMLPVSWDPLSNPYEVFREQVLLETGRGVTYEYELFSRDTPIYIFTIPASLLAEFRAMHDAVVGQPFHFIPDIDQSPFDGIHVRKEPSFHVDPIGVYLFEGTAEQWFRYELRLRTEITAASIED